MIKDPESTAMAILASYTRDRRGTPDDGMDLANFEREALKLIETGGYEQVRPASPPPARSQGCAAVAAAAAARVACVRETPERPLWRARGGVQAVTQLERLSQLIDAIVSRLRKKLPRKARQVGACAPPTLSMLAWRHRARSTGTPRVCAKGLAWHELSLC
jgi:hypothetical protein